MKTRLLIIGCCLLLSLSCLGQQAGRVFLDVPSGTLHQTFYSIGEQDGWVLEASEDSGLGSDLDVLSSSLRLGDDSAHSQFRTILSFDTSPLPDTAIITSVKLTLFQESIVIGGGNPFADFGGLFIDLKTGPFGDPGLQSSDFQSVPDVGPLGPYLPALADSYTFALGRDAYPYINKWWLYDGLTQLRLRFRMPNNGDGRANYIHLYSGDDPAPSHRPVLFVEYHLPTPVRQD